MGRAFRRRAQGTHPANPRPTAAARTLNGTMDVQANYLEKILGDNEAAKYAIREVPHFRNCSEDLLNLVYTYGRIFSLREGENLTREGEFDQWVYFMLSGKLAVLVGGELVDTISSSLVGERCIFGEPRKATLSADAGGVTALGIDMAILDTLQGGNSGGGAASKAPIYVELLSIITGEIVDRIADLAYNQIDISSKLATNIKADQLTDIITALLENGYGGNPEANIAIYKFLMKQDKALLALSLQDDKITVDTRKFYSHCVNMGKPQLVLELANAIHDFQETGGELGIDMKKYTGQYNFHHFVRVAYEKISQHYKGIRPDGGGREITESGWREQFRLGGALRIELDRVCDWLKRAYRYTDLQLIDALVALLKAASSYTAEINKANKQMMFELSQIKSLKKLESVTAGEDSIVPDYYASKTPEEMIPMFSKHVLEVHLINPYLERLGAAAAARRGHTPAQSGPATAGESVPPESGGDAQSLADSLFE